MLEVLRLPPGHALDLPPRLTNQEGQPRRVGVELEFAGLDAQLSAHFLRDALGGEVVQNDPHAFLVEGSSLGDIEVSLDTRLAHPKKSGRSLLGGMERALAGWLGSAVRSVVPCELVTSPLPIERLAEFDQAVDVLRQAGARGTQDAPFYAFGLHFNPETPRHDVETIAAILRSFVLLNGWLRRQVSPDLTRNLLGFADPFPRSYVERLVAPGYQPDLPAFIDDYLAANPTRNRDLDLLPLLCFLDEERVRARLPGEKINKRPAFHYRLPDGRVSDPGWSIVPDWNRWVAIERLAADASRLEALGEHYLAFQGDDKSWTDRVERIAFS